MNILVIAADYPKPLRETAGIFNERSVIALRRYCDHVEVLVPRPYAPAGICSWVPRWSIYARTPSRQMSAGITVHRPGIPIVPRLGSAFWLDRGAFLWCRRKVAALHRKIRFDAILSFDLAGAGGIAWRMGRHLGVPASGWATGGDVRQSAGSMSYAALRRTLESLNVVFYQSQELRGIAARILEVPAAELSASRHIVLPRGIPAPPSLCRSEARASVRRQWGVREDQIVVLSIGRVSREKGIPDLIEAVSLAIDRNPKIVCIVVGASPAFDESEAIRRHLSTTPRLQGHVKIFPACDPAEVWKHFCGGDIFAFTSRHEGMPNSLLEAMAMGLPAIAFAIPPVAEIRGATDALVAVDPFDSVQFSDAVLRLAGCEQERRRIGRIGHDRVMDRFMIDSSMKSAVRRLEQEVGSAGQPAVVFAQQPHAALEHAEPPNA